MYREGRRICICDCERHDCEIAENEDSRSLRTVLLGPVT